MLSPEQIPIRILINRQEGRGTVVLPEEASGFIAGRFPWIEDPLRPLTEEADQVFFRLLSGTEGEKWLLREERGGKGSAWQLSGLLRLAEVWKKKRRRGRRGRGVV